MKPQTEKFTINYAQKEVELPAGYCDVDSGQIHKTVVIREMTGVEEDILLNAEHARSGMVLNKILDNICELKDKPGMKFVNDLLIVDQYFLMVQARILTYGNIYTFEVAHDKDMGGCGAKTTIRLELDSLEFKGPENPAELESSVVLPKSGLKVVFKKNQGKDQPALLKLAQRNSQDKVSQILQYRTKTILSPDGTELDKSIIKDIPAMDRKFLREYMNKSEGKAETELSTHCATCGELMKIEMPLGADFFCLGGRES